MNNNDKEIDFTLDEIRKSCELGEIENVLILSKKLEILITEKDVNLNLK